MQPKLYYFFLVSLILQVFTGHVFADQNLAKTSQNPVGNIISLPFDNNLYFDTGPRNKAINALLIKPVIRFSFTQTEASIKIKVLLI